MTDLNGAFDRLINGPHKLLAGHAAIFAHSMIWWTGH
jgi:hypothetical protein